MKKNNILLFLILPLIIGCGNPKPTSSENNVKVDTNFTYNANDSMYNNYLEFNKCQDNVLIYKSSISNNYVIEKMNDLYWDNYENYIIGIQNETSTSYIEEFKNELGEDEYEYLVNFDLTKMFKNIKNDDVDKEGIEKNCKDILLNIENEDSIEIIKERLNNLIDDYRNLIDEDQLISIKADLYTDNSYYANERTSLDVLYSSISNSYKKIFKELLSSELYKDEIVSYYELSQDDINSFLGASVFDDETLSLFEEETILQNSYNSASTTSIRNQIYVDLINLRKRIATALGYDNYLDYRYEKIYKRQYTLKDAESLVENVKKYMVAPFQEASKVYESAYRVVTSNPINEKQLLDSLDLVTKYFVPNGKKSLKDLKTYGYYNFDVRTNKFNGSYQTSIDSYDSMHYILLNTSGDIGDYPSLFHETGHYLASEIYDIGLEGNSFDLDVAEIHSQGLEYLMGNYYNELVGEELAKSLNQFQIFNACWTIMSGSLITAFENYVYTTDETITTTNLQNKFNELYTNFTYPYSFGFEGNNAIYSVVSHLFLSPGYYISYVTSIIASLQLYANPSLENAISSYNKLLDYGTSNEFMYVLEKANLNSPFEEETIKNISEKFNEIILK